MKHESICQQDEGFLASPPHTASISTVSKFKGGKGLGNWAISLPPSFFLDFPLFHDFVLGLLIKLRLSLTTFSPAYLVILEMPGVQSFVAQRQQGYQSPNREILGARNRVKVPATTLERAKEKPLFHGRQTNPPTSPSIAGQNTHISRQHLFKASDIQSGFDTDAEGFDETATTSIEGSSRGHQDEGDGRDHTVNRYSADAANGDVSGVQVPFGRRREQLYHVQESSQLNAEGFGEENCGELSDAEEDEGPDEEKVVHDGILRDLNSPGFSQYLQEKTSYTTQVAGQPLGATAIAARSLALRDVGQHSRTPANPFNSTGRSANPGAADLSVGLKGVSRQAHESVTNKTLEVPFQKVPGSSMEQLLISPQYPKLSGHRGSSQLPLATSHQTLWPTRMSGDTIATYASPQIDQEKSLSVQQGSIDFCDDEPSVEWDADFDRRHNRKSTASADSPQRRNRARDLDYSPAELSGMTFQQLSHEPFNPLYDTAQTSIPQELSRGTLVARLDYILEKLKDDDAKLVRRKAFFSSLSIEQYEECAKLLTYRFSAVMSKFADARQQRRRVAKYFEEEVARRELCVRGKNTAVDQDLGRLKRGGEEVVKGAAA